MHHLEEKPANIKTFTHARRSIFDRRTQNDGMFHTGTERFKPFHDCPVKNATVLDDGISPDFLKLGVHEDGRAVIARAVFCTFDNVVSAADLLTAASRRRNRGNEYVVRSGSVQSREVLDSS